MAYPLCRISRRLLPDWLSARNLGGGPRPRELIEACRLGPAPLDLKAGFNPDQPRVPAGNSDGGQWTSDETLSASALEGVGSSMPPQGAPSSAVRGTGPKYQLIKKPPEDAKVVAPPDGVPIRGGNPPKPLIAPPHADYRKVYAQAERSRDGHFGSNTRALTQP